MSGGDVLALLACWFIPGLLFTIDYGHPKMILGWPYYVVWKGE